MIEQLKNWDEALFLFLNAQHNGWLDPIMSTLTGTIIWAPFYLFLIYLVIKKDSKQAIWYLGGIVLLILLADQFTSGFMKPYFERLRPCHDPRWQGVISNYSGCGGLYGFASSHASNTFAIATYLYLIFRKASFLWLFLWCTLVSYTRIYLGVHYPADIIVGAIVGIMAAWVTYSVITYLLKRNSNRKADMA